MLARCGEKVLLHGGGGRRSTVNTYVHLPLPWRVICQLVSKKREKLASEFIFNKDVKKNSFLHFMYTNYITTDSWFVPKERLSLLLLCFFLSFFLFLSYPLYSLPLFTHFYYLREETQGEERKIYVHNP